MDHARLRAAVAGAGGPPNDVYPIGSWLVAEVLNPPKADGCTYVDLLKPEETVSLPLTVALCSVASPAATIRRSDFRRGLFALSAAR